MCWVVLQGVMITLCAQKYLLFLLSLQILTENVISGLSVFSPPVRALISLLYRVRRIFVILDWICEACRLA
ncbi:hypothetical protein RchiOBHm_Chr5g0015841 [Rosa chinensis]|uniref:DUF7733 domain-containing protein n=1 Tax=Rosa chinensis TaxID=74649 RepID=A0A2P6Q620_ROSCH|nr:hypothetical protein RchiOBHm_Chr5g0015841 [Rosa chinensis]